MICPACASDNIAGAEVCATCGRDLGGLDLRQTAGPDFVDDPLTSIAGRPAARVSVSDPVSLAVRRMQSKATGCVLVLDGDRLAGIVTAWDILHKVAGHDEDLNAVPCRQIMTADPVLFRDDDTVAVAINKMAIGDFRHIPVMREGAATHVLDVSDLFRFISPHLV